MFSCCCGEEFLASGNSNPEITPEVIVPVLATQSLGDVTSDSVSPPPSNCSSSSVQGALEKRMCSQASSPRSQTTGPSAKTRVDDLRTPLLVKPISAPKRERARRTSDPAESVVGDGIFLLYDKEKSTMVSKWSHIPVEDALAWLQPLVRVPEHKYKVNGGRHVLATGLESDNRYCEGWVNFVRLSNDYPSKLMLFDNYDRLGAPRIQFLQLTEGSAADTGLVRRELTVEAIVEYNKLFDLKNIKAVAVVPLSSSLITIGSPMEAQKFLQMGRGEGGASALAPRG